MKIKVADCCKNTRRPILWRIEFGCKNYRQREREREVKMIFLLFDLFFIVGTFLNTHTLEEKTVGTLLLLIVHV